VADEADAVELDELGAGAAEVDCLLSPPDFASLASWVGVSFPKKGSSKAWLMVPTVNTKPNAPATTAMRWPIALTEAAFVRTACGSWLKDDAPKAGATPAEDWTAVVAEGAVPLSDSWARMAFRLARPAEAVAAAASWAGLFA